MNKDADNTNSTADNVTITTTTGTGAELQSSRPDYEKLYQDAIRESETWQKRFTGLQGKYQQEREKWGADSSKLLETDESLVKTVGELEALRTQLTTITSAKDILESEKEILSAQMQRLTIVTTEFPHLVPFLKDDLLPDDTGDDLRNKLKIMTDRLGTMQMDKMKDTVAGSSPSDSPNSSADTPEKLMKQIAAAVTAGNMQQYDQLYEQLMKVSR